jgi:hypothetical protein
MRTLVCSAFVVLAFGSFGCEKQESLEKSTEPVASVDKVAALDPAVAKALAQASAAARSNRRGPAATPGGPPPSGVFDPGEADREAKRGSPPKVTLGDRGKEPRVALGSVQPKPGWKSQGTVQVVIQPPDPRQQAAPVTVALSLEAQKPKVGDAGAGVPGGAADAVTVLAKVTGAQVAVAGVPAETNARVAMLKGAKIEYQVAPDGSGAGFRYDAGAAADLVDYLRVLSDALALVTLPVPTEPLGKGGFFMTTSREGIYGLDLVTYRMVKVEDVEGDKVTLSVGTKRYAATRKFDFPGLAADAPRDLIEFDAQSEARLERRVGVPFPLGGEVASLLAARLGTAQQSGLLQIQSKVALAFPDKAAPAATAKKPASDPAPAAAPTPAPAPAP